MPRHGLKKHGSLKKAVSKDKHNKNMDPALQNFSCLNGIVVDFQKLFNYQPPFLPIYDVRLIDRFNPTVAKYEYVMIKIEEEFHSMDYSVTKFSRVSKKLVNIFNQMKNVWEISPDFVQKQILKAYDQLPQITLESALSLNEPCMLDFMTLTIAMKYIIILRKYKSHIREQILQKRDLVLRSYVEQHKLDGRNKGLHFYEWFLSLMLKYAENNNKLASRNNVSTDCDLSIPYILPFVGLGSSMEFYSAHAICRSHDNSQYEFKEESDSIDRAQETDNGHESHMSKLAKAEQRHVSDFYLEDARTEQHMNSSEKQEKPLCLETLPNEEDYDLRTCSVETEKCSSSDDENGAGSNPQLAERFQREAVIMNDAFIRFVHNNFNQLSPEQLELTNAVRSATVSSIREMSSYLENEELNYSADELGREEWDLLCQYVRICHRVLVGEEECEEIARAVDKKELNELRLSFLTHYESQRLEEIKQNMEEKVEHAKQSKNIKKNFDSHQEYTDVLKDSPQEDEPCIKSVVFCEAKNEEKLTDEDMTPEEIRMMKLYMKTSRPGRSCDTPTWDYDSSDDDLYIH